MIKVDATASVEATANIGPAAGPILASEVVSLSFRLHTRIILISNHYKTSLLKQVNNATGYLLWKNAAKCNTLGPS